jgi:hypothetical protein
MNSVCSNRGKIEGCQRSKASRDLGMGGKSSEPNVIVRHGAE